VANPSVRSTPLDVVLVLDEQRSRVSLAESENGPKAQREAGEDQNNAVQATAGRPGMADVRNQCGTHMTSAEPDFIARTKPSTGTAAESETANELLRSAAPVRNVRAREPNRISD